MATNRRDQIRMDDDEVTAFIEEQKSLQVACLDADGSPHLSTLWFALVDGRLAFITYTRSQKVVNLHRDPRITVLLEDGTEYGSLRGVMVKGRAMLHESGPELIEVARAVVVRNNDGLPAEAVDAAAAQLASKRTAVVVEPDKVVSWDHTKLGGVH